MNPFTYSLPQVAKALAAGVTAGLAAVVPALADGRLSLVEGLTVAGAVIVAAATVFAVPNAPQGPQA